MDGRRGSEGDARSEVESEDYQSYSEEDEPFSEIGDPDSVEVSLPPPKLLSSAAPVCCMVAIPSPITHSAHSCCQPSAHNEACRAKPTETALDLIQLTMYKSRMRQMCSTRPKNVHCCLAVPLADIWIVA